MAYTINKTDGTILATITDGTTNRSVTNLTLIGKSYSGWGENLNENLVRLLENAASTSSPTTPLRGQLWFDVNTGQLKVYNGSQFEPAGGAQPATTEPVPASYPNRVFGRLLDSRPGSGFILQPACPSAKA